MYQVYREFDEELKILLQSENGIQNYPSLCKRITKKFAEIGNVMVKIKGIIVSKGKKHDKDILEMKSSENSPINKSQSTTHSDNQVGTNIEKLHQLSKYIQLVQEKEKDKLLMIGAAHLDILQDRLKELQDITGGKTERQEQYLKDKINETEKIISESIENIMSIKSDLLEESEL